MASLIPDPQTEPKYQDVSAGVVFGYDGSARETVSLEGDTTRLPRAIHLKQAQAVQVAECLMERAGALKVEYEQNWLLEDVKERIRTIRDALAMLSGFPSRPDLTVTDSALLSQPAELEVSGILTAYLYELSSALGDRYNHTGQLADLDERVDLLRIALGHSSHDATLSINIQSDLGAALRTRCFDAADNDAVIEAFKFHSALLDAHPEGDLHHPRLLYELAETLFVRDNAFGNSGDLPWCTSLLNKTLDLLPEPGPCRNAAQHTLAKATLAQSMRGGDISLLHAAAAIYRHLLCVQPLHHPGRWLLWSGLGTSVGILSYRTYDSDMVFLNEALDCSRRAVSIVDSINPNGGRAVLSLSNALIRRYYENGDMEDLQECIGILQLRVDIPHSGRPSIMCALGVALDYRWEALGAADDLDESIKLQREVVSTKMVPPGQPRKHLLLLTFAESLQKRYQRDKGPGDITEAINLLREAILPAWQTSDSLSAVVTSLGNCLCYFYEDFGDQGKLEEAIALCEDSLAGGRGEELARNEGFHSMHAWVTILRFKRRHDMEDLSLAVSRYEKALSFASDGNIMKHIHTQNLAEALFERFEVLHVDKDAEKAKMLLEDATACLPLGHPDRALLLFQLARLHLTPGAPCFSVQSALVNMNLALGVVSQNAQTRLAIALGVLKLFELHEISAIQDDSTPLRQGLLDLYISIIGLLPRVAYFGLDITSRLRVLANSEKLASNGAIHALLLDQPQFAITLLEKGRAVFWSQHLRLRTAFDALPTDLAAKLSHAAVQLERGSHTVVVKEEGHSDLAKAAQEIEATKQRHLNETFEALIVQARSLPGFERFMLPETFQVLGAASIQGPIVVLLANEFTCQAVVIENPGTVHQITLSEISLQQLQAINNDMHGSIRRGRDLVRGRAMKRVPEKGGMMIEKVLAQLWRKILQKIVNTLQIKRTEGRERPRVTLCPTGVFAYLPLHAAGVYGGSPENVKCLSDFCVTSYTPTLGVLLNARQQSQPVPAITTRMLLASVSRPPKWRQLPSAIEEARAIRSVTPSHIPVDFLSDVQEYDTQCTTVPTVNNVMERLPEVSILHLACHGHQDPHKPLESGFVMHDGMLTVAKLMSLNLDKAYLAFLSACETAKGDKTQPDQAIHLAATMLFSGFKSVIGTMWSMNDLDGPLVAKTVYEGLFQAGPEVLDLDGIPYALDLAVRKLRAKGLAASRWAPYVHLGM